MRFQCEWCEADFPDSDAKLDWNRRSCDRCKRRICGNCPGCSEPRRCDGFIPMYECPECGRVGTVKAIGEYGLKIYDGRKLSTVWFSGLPQALDAGFTTWGQLTPGEQEAFSIPPMEFQVIDSEDTVLRDWGAELRSAIKRNRGRF